MCLLSSGGKGYVFNMSGILGIFVRLRACRYLLLEEIVCTFLPCSQFWWC